MKSTVEVMELDNKFPRAFAKSQIAARNSLPSGGSVFKSLKDIDKKVVKSAGKQFQELGIKLVATGGTEKFFQARRLNVKPPNKVLGG